MNLNHADAHIFIMHALPLSNVFIIAHSVSVVLDFRQNPPDLPCFKHQAPGAAASAPNPPLSKAFLCSELPIFSSVKRWYKKPPLPGTEQSCSNWMRRENKRWIHKDRQQQKLMRALHTIYCIYFAQRRENTTEEKEFVVKLKLWSLTLCFHQAPLCNVTCPTPFCSVLHMASLGAFQKQTAVSAWLWLAQIVFISSYSLDFCASAADE